MADAPVVHVGYPKTATTWLQHRVYPTVESHTHVSPAAVLDAFWPGNALAFDPEPVRAKLDGGSRPVLACHEGLVGSPCTAGMQGYATKAIAAHIRDVWPDARIVLTIRNQVDLVTACYVQYVKNGGTRGPAGYLFPTDRRRWLGRTARERMLFSLDYVAFDRVVALYERLFGPERVTVVCYEDLLADPRGTLWKLAHGTGLDLDVEALDVSPRNTRMGRGTLALARAVNRLGPPVLPDQPGALGVMPWKTRRRVLKLLDRTPLAGGRATPRAVLGEAALARIRDRVGEDNRALAARLDLDLAARGYPTGGEG